MKSVEATRVGCSSDQAAQGVEKRLTCIDLYSFRQPQRQRCPPTRYIGRTVLVLPSTMARYTASSPHLPRSENAHPVELQVLREDIDFAVGTLRLLRFILDNRWSSGVRRRNARDEPADELPTGGPGGYQRGIWPSSHRWGQVRTPLGGRLPGASFGDSPFESVVRLCLTAGLF